MPVCSETEINNMPACRILNEDVPHTAGKLLQVSGKELIQSLTHRTTFAHGEVIVTPLSAEQAHDVRDAFVKGIYGRVFIWIVNKINEVIYKEPVSHHRAIYSGILVLTTHQAICTRTHTHTHTRARTHARTQAHTHAHTCTHAHSLFVCV